MKMKILTPSGFQPFEGVARYWHDKSLKFVFENGTVESAYDHKFIVDNKEIFAHDVQIGDNIGKIVKDIIEISSGDYFYDPVNVSNGKIYNHDNGFISHNTFFGTGDTLINAETLMALRANPPKSMLEGNSVYIYEETQKDHDYIMTVDVSKGRGQDYSTFNVIDISTRPFKQVAVYRNNTISPILFPNIIYKYAKVYNDAYVVIEANDQGGVVCNGLYYDFEYENMHVESAIKANALGIEMNRKVKRLGCSTIKDILETQKLDIVDENTILEISTFIARGQSYEASDGNHDDLMMNLVMFGYFSLSSQFGEITDINLKEMMYKNRMQEIDNDMVPFGFVDDGLEEVERTVDPREPWAVERNFNDNFY
jgi:hypothetical protein